MPVNNLAPGLCEEVSKWKYNGEDLDAIADTAITIGMCCALVASAVGRPHIRRSNVAGEESVIAITAGAVGDIVMYRETGCVGGNLSGLNQFPVPSNSRLMSAGDGALLVHANGNYVVGYNLWPGREANHRVAVEIRHYYR